MKRLDAKMKAVSLIIRAPNDVHTPPMGVPTPAHSSCRPITTSQPLTPSLCHLPLTSHSQDEAELAKARKTVSSGMAAMAEAQQAANKSATDVAAAQKGVEDAKAKLEEALMTQHKISLRLKAIGVDIERARGVVTNKSKEQETSAVDMVKRKLEVEKARAAAMKAAQALSFPPNLPGR